MTSSMKFCVNYWPQQSKLLVVLYDGMTSSRKFCKLLTSGSCDSPSASSSIPVCPCFVFWCVRCFREDQGEIILWGRRRAPQAWLSVTWSASRGSAKDSACSWSDGIKIISLLSLLSSTSKTRDRLRSHSDGWNEIFQYHRTKPNQNINDVATENKRMYDVFLTCNFLWCFFFCQEVKKVLVYYILDSPPNSNGSSDIIVFVISHQDIKTMHCAHHMILSYLILIILR